MILKTIEIQNIGPLERISIQLSPHINLVQGANGTGKTTLLAAVYSLFQDQEIFQYRSEQKVPARIRLRIENQNQSMGIEKYYNEGTPQLILRSFQDIARLSELKRHQIFMDGGSYFAKGVAKQSASDLCRAADFLERLKIEPIDYFEDYFKTEGRYYLLSGGEQFLLRMVNLLSLLPDKSIFLMDEPFGRLDQITAQRLLSIMGKMPAVQFIIAANPAYLYELPDTAHTIMLPPNGPSRENAALTYIYNRIWEEDLEKRLQRQELEGTEVDTSGRLIVKYRLHTRVEEEENRNVEFKEVKGLNPCDSIAATAEIYIAAFLNSWETQVGMIKWGINDSGDVVGVRLSRADRDTIRRKLSERVAQFKPYLSQEVIRIEFQEIIDADNELMPGLYVLEISVEPVRCRDLFVTSRNEVYIKSESGKVKLDAYDTQQELKRRLGMRK